MHQTDINLTTKDLGDDDFLLNRLGFCFSNDAS
jgi:hypothetical protein